MVGFAAEHALHTLLSMMIGSASVPEATITDITCMAQNIWFETRSGGFEDKIAVGHVVLNRVRAGNYPDTICEVIWQPKQFSWTHDGQSDEVELINRIDREAWMRAVMAAHLTMTGEVKDFSNGATHYHANYVSPGWSKAMTNVAVHGQHIYYRTERDTVPATEPATLANDLTAHAVATRPVEATDTPKPLQRPAEETPEPVIAVVQAAPEPEDESRQKFGQFWQILELDVPLF